jgi:hypothetical protein
VLCLWDGSRALPPPWVDCRLMPAPRRKFTTYAPPGRDSARAKANAVWALLNTPEHKLGTLAPEQLARDFRLKAGDCRGAACG